MVRIAVIDTGIDKSSSKIDSSIVHDIVFDKNIDTHDTVGHGTALTILYQSLFSNISIYSFKVFQGYVTNVELVIKALEYIDLNVEVDLINLSIGLHVYSKELEDICWKLYQKGVILIAAFDNSSYLSYPAAFDFVIGVSKSENLIKPNEYIFVENSPINILGYSGTQVLDWLGSEKKIVIGNSFILPYIAKYIWGNIVEISEQTVDLKENLKKNAIQVITFNNNILDMANKRKINLKKIKKAVVFPVNKEILNLLNNKNSLLFDIVDIYDFKYSSKISKNISSFLYKNNYEELVIKSITSIDWDKIFDTFILGHIEMVSHQINETIFENIIQQCLLKKKNLVLFDNFDISSYEQLFKENNCFIYSPNFNENVKSNTFGELWYTSTPILCVSGTSSKQGKFNLQLEIKQEMEKEGYSIGQIGTEPNSELQNFDFTYPNGYGTNNRFSNGEEIMFLNQLTHSLENKDLIIVGTQSNLVPYFQGHINAFPLVQRNVLLGVQPDAIILCINSFDTIEYIQRTIDYVSAYYEIMVIALVLYPIEKKIDHLTGKYTEKSLTEIELLNCITNFEKEIKLPVFINGKNINLLAKLCIQSFT